MPFVTIGPNLQIYIRTKDITVSIQLESRWSTGGVLIA